MMTEIPKTPDFLLRFTLNITSLSDRASFYLINAEVCWNQVTRKPCKPYDDTNQITHQQVLMKLNGGDGSCTAGHPMGCPRYHIWRNGSRVHRSDAAHFPYEAWDSYCGPQVCSEMEPGEPRCGAYSNPNSQSIYMLRPHPEWLQYGLPATGADARVAGLVGKARTYEINVGALYEHLWFPCDMPAEKPKEVITMNIGPETHDVGVVELEWVISDFDVLVPLGNTS
jgi:hypothetical protein